MGDVAEVNPDFVERYVSLWSEPDPRIRRQTIEHLWAPDGANDTQTTQAVSYDGLDARVRAAYERPSGRGTTSSAAGLPRSATTAR